MTAFNCKVQRFSQKRFLNEDFIFISIIFIIIKSRATPGTIVPIRSMLLNGH